MLRSRLYQVVLDERKQKEKQRYSEKQEIAWGSQIRSYVLHPYNLVKDHRTEFESSNTQAVLGGDLDAFLEAYLKMKAQKS